MAKTCAMGALMEGPSADCPAAGDKPILEESANVQCKEHGRKCSGRHTVFPVGRAGSACQIVSVNQEPLGTPMPLWTLCHLEVMSKSAAPACPAFDTDMILSHKVHSQESHKSAEQW